VLGLPPASPPPAELAARRLLTEEPLARAETAITEAARRHGLA
jgi:hypothetical protein